MDVLLGWISIVIMMLTSGLFIIHLIKLIERKDTGRVIPITLFISIIVFILVYSYFISKLIRGNWSNFSEVALILLLLLNIGYIFFVVQIRKGPVKTFFSLVALVCMYAYIRITLGDVDIFDSLVF